MPLTDRPDDLRKQVQQEMLHRRAGAETEINKHTNAPTHAASSLP